MILGDDIIYPQAFKAYDDFKKKNKLITEGKDFDKIQEITEDIKKAINIFYERRISWPINTKKQFDFANMDYIKVLKFINEIKKI